MTSFLGIWGTEHHLGRTDQTFDLFEMWLQQVAYRFILWTWGVAERSAHDKEREKSPV
jgi:hypothetical protein